MNAAMTMPEPITRPNGKTWRGRKPIRFDEFGGWYGGTGWVVFGTHDVDLALRALGDERVFEYSLTRDRAEQTWWRKVPWNSDGYDYSYITDPDRGTPCVVFEP